MDPHGYTGNTNPPEIMENVRFVNDVESLILQLGCVPGALLSDSSSEVDFVERTGVPISVEMPVPAQLPRISKFPSLPPPLLVGQSFHSVGWEAVDNGHYNASVSGVPKNNVPGVSMSSSIGQSSKNYASQPRLNNGNMNGAETICLYHDLSGKKLPGFSTQEPEIGQLNVHNHVSFPKLLIIEGAGSHLDGNIVDDTMKRGSSMLFSNDHKLTPGNNMGPPSVTSCSLPNAGRADNMCPPVLEDIALSSLLDQLNTNGRMSGCSDSIYSLQASGSMDHQIPSLVRDDRSKLATGSKSVAAANSEYENSCALASLGDDLYDMLCVEHKSRLINEPLNEAFRNEEGLHSDNSSASGGKLDGNIFSVADTDHLLDGVVSRACSASKQTSSDSSYRKMFTDPRGSQPSGGRIGLPDPGQKEILNFPEYMAEAGSVTSGSWNHESNSCPIAASSYGSQLTSWISDSTSKTPGKRLKPGENPRPRAKNRQLFQDRVTELREIVPDGEKLSIEALLERTIEHMLFLQSVTKQADKLKQTRESKLFSKEGRLLVNGNYEGGKPWAFEVGSQSTICPIIVEHLNPPRLLLVQMLCEERGFFLEIADLIRGMGLTILKGVMESRNGEIWAQFTVEADRDVTRREVSILLVHFLEQVKSGMASASNNPENSHI